MSDPSPPFDRDSHLYVTRPTRFTVFLRTFLPWQVWRFVRINLKMIGIIRRDQLHRPVQARRRRRWHRL